MTALDYAQVYEMESSTEAALAEYLQLQSLEPRRQVLGPIAALLGSAVLHWRIWDAERRRRERLDQLVPLLWQHRLALVVAPAGSGKTTLLAAWAGLADAPAAWYRAESVDGSERSLAAHLGAAFAAAARARLPELIGEAMARLALHAHECVMIGDRHLDIDGARHHRMLGIESHRDPDRHADRRGPLRRRRCTTSAPSCGSRSSCTRSSCCCASRTCGSMTWCAPRRGRSCRG